MLGRMDPEIDRVLSFWFGPPGAPPLANAERWFTRDAAFDAAIREGFEGRRPGSSRRGARRRPARWRS
jgi:uncharacterized protein (DUF924 family)